MQPNKTYAEIFEAVAFRSLVATDTAFNGLDTQSAAWFAVHDTPDVAKYVEPVIRLYQAAFNRVPDATGLDFWVNAYRNGTATLDQIASGFTASSEFQASFGPAGQPNSALITALYHNVLGRDADDAGQTFWQNSGVSAAKMLVGFAQSSEFINKTTPFAEEFLISSAEGFQTHTGSLLAGALYSIQETDKAQRNGATSITYRAEFNTSINGLDISDFVVTNHGGTASGTIDQVVQSGFGSFPYNVSIGVTVHGSGSISVDLKPNAGLSDSAGHTVALTGLAGEIITV